MKSFHTLILIGLLVASPARAASPVVLELFTSQGCPSCPPADALLQKLSADPNVLALSFHVDYFDGPAGKDPFSLAASTARQTLYQRMFNQKELYTPEMVVDGQRAMIGSRKDDVMVALEVASERPKPFTISIVPSTDRRQLTVNFIGQKPGDVKTAGVWLITFNPPAVSAVHGGEKSRRELTSINNVTSITRLGIIKDPTPLPMTASMSGDPTSGYAVLVQESSGRVIGAGSYLP